MVFYFSGHGCQVIHEGNIFYDREIWEIFFEYAGAHQPTNYLIPVDANLETPDHFKRQCIALYDDILACILLKFYLCFYDKIS